MSDVSVEKPIVRELKDRALFMGWIAGLIIVGALIWTLMRPLLTSYLLETINNSFAVSGKSLRLDSPEFHPPVKPFLLGIWFTIDDSPDRLFIFTVMQDGIMIPCGARVTSEGKVADVIPISAHARKVFDRLSAGVLSIYTRRIENIAAHWSEK